MINLRFNSYKWGTDHLDDGLQVNVLDEDSQIMVHIPIVGDSASEFAVEVIHKLSPERRQRVLAQLNAEQNGG